MTHPTLDATRARRAATIAVDAPAAAALHTALTHRLQGRQGAAGGRSAPGPRYPDTTAIEARTLIRHRLVGWCLLVAEERSVGLPGHWVIDELTPGFIGPPNRRWTVADELPAMGAYLKLHANWLAEHDAGQECADELADLAHGWAWRVCYPTGTRIVPLDRPCPYGECDGTLRAILRPDGDRYESEVVCTGEERHGWAVERWREFRPVVAA